MRRTPLEETIDDEDDGAAVENQPPVSAPSQSGEAPPGGDRGGHRLPHTQRTRSIGHHEPGSSRLVTAKHNLLISGPTGVVPDDFIATQASIIEAKDLLEVIDDRSEVR